MSVVLIFILSIEAMAGLLIRNWVKRDYLQPRKKEQSDWRKDSKTLLQEFVDEY